MLRSAFWTQIIDKVDAVLISHADPAHLGALPYLAGSLKMQAPVYVTVPVHKMGQMFMYDQFLSRQQSSNFEAFSLDDVDSAFQRMRQLKYQQQVRFTGMAAQLVVSQGLCLLTVKGMLPNVTPYQ